jgi:hypothetical protein
MFSGFRFELILVSTAFLSVGWNSSSVVAQEQDKTRFPTYCDVYCPVDDGERSCQLHIYPDDYCGCTCRGRRTEWIPDAPPLRDWPDGWKPAIEKNGTTYKLEFREGSSPKPADLASQQLQPNGQDSVQASVGGAAVDIAIGVLTPAEANPKGEPKTVIMKDDGTVGGYIRDDGEFVPGKPAWMK